MDPVVRPGVARLPNTRRSRSPAGDGLRRKRAAFYTEGQQLPGRRLRRLTGLALSLASMSAAHGEGGRRHGGQGTSSGSDAPSRAMNPGRARHAPGPMPRRRRRRSARGRPRRVAEAVRSDVVSVGAGAQGPGAVGTRQRGRRPAVSQPVALERRDARGVTRGRDQLQDVALLVQPRDRPARRSGPARPGTLPRAGRATGTRERVRCRRPPGRQRLPRPSGRPTRRPPGGYLRLTEPRRLFGTPRASTASRSLSMAARSVIAPNLLEA